MTEAFHGASVLVEERQADYLVSQESPSPLHFLRAGEDRRSEFSGAELEI